MESRLLEHEVLFQKLRVPYTTQPVRAALLVHVAWSQFHLLLACAFTLCDSEAQKKGYLNKSLTELFVYTIQMNKFNLGHLV